jgi:hypothetical protein
MVERMARQTLSLALIKRCVHRVFVGKGILEARLRARQIQVCLILV